MSRSVRARTFDRAARAWVAGKPHTAWQILAEAGLTDQWPAFLRVALARARRTYLTHLPPRT